MTPNNQIEEIVEEIIKEIPNFSICTNGQNWANDYGQTELIKFTAQKLSDAKDAEREKAVEEARRHDQEIISDTMRSYQAYFKNHEEMMVVLNAIRSQLSVQPDDLNPSTK